MMIILAFVSVGAYQYYKWQNKKEAQREIFGKKNYIAATTARASASQNMGSNVGGAASQQFDQMKKMLEEMEGLKQKTNDIGSAIGGFSKGLKSMNGPTLRGQRNNNKELFEDSEEDN